MAITTEHKFIDKFPIKPESKRLIVGTIHPHKTSDFITDFFYGNKNSLWEILAEAFPHLNFSNKKHIIDTLNANLIAITDIIKTCDRENESITTDEDLYNIEPNTDQIREGLLNSSISTIYFTSRFGKNNAAKLFVKYFKIKYRDTWNDDTSSFIIPKEVFNREIKAIVLFSPSGQANIGISRSKAYLSKKHLYSDNNTPVKKFKIDFYKEKFNFLQER